MSLVVGGAIFFGEESANADRNYLIPARTGSSACSTITEQRYAVLPGPCLISEPAGQVGGRARRHSLWTSQPSTTSTNAMTPVG
jgi:hypothetical protein